MNIDDVNECKDLREWAKAENASLPRYGNGGIWIQPLGLPKQPRLKNVKDIGTLICSRKRYEEENTSCKLCIYHKKLLEFIHLLRETRDQNLKYLQAMTQKLF